MRYPRYVLMLLLVSYPILVFAHEPWLLTESHWQTLLSQPAPPLFRELGFFNITICLLAAAAVLTWLTFHIFSNTYKPSSYNNQQLNYALFALRLGTGSTLILLATGILTKHGVPPYTACALLAPEFIISQLPAPWPGLAYLPIIIGLGLILGSYIRLWLCLLSCLVIINFYLFGNGMWQYVGFYLAIITFLFRQGAGQLAVAGVPSRSIQLPQSLLWLQFFTGCNFIYSALSIKLLHPMVDIGLLQAKAAFTLFIPYDYFTFLMLVTEVSFGLLIIVGYRLRLVASLLFILFVLLSIDLAENLFLHNFIYGILLTFCLLGGEPFMKRRRYIN